MKAAEATRRKRFIIEHSRGKIYLWKAASLSNLVANGQKFGHIWRIGGTPARQNVRSPRGTQRVVTR